MNVMYPIASAFVISTPSGLPVSQKLEIGVQCDASSRYLSLACEPLRTYQGGWRKVLKMPVKNYENSGDPSETSEE